MSSVARGGPKGMGNVILDISVSLDGFVAGPDPTLDEPLGKGGEQLHEWAFAAKAWRERHGLEGGDEGLDSQLVADGLDRVSATVMGRRMFSGGEGPWEQDPNAEAWWGDEPPFGHPVFVLTHHARAPLVKGATTFTFVTDGVAAAVERARAAAGERDVTIGGGGHVARQCLAAGLLDELRIHVAPVLLGGGTRLFDGGTGRLELLDALESPSGVTHLRYRPRG